jgi:hypothetical protein
MADKDLYVLLAELGGDSPQNRAVAEGLDKQGVSSTKDIGVRTVMETRYQPHIEDITPGGTEEVPVKQFYNKTDGSEIDPNRLGIIESGQSGVEDGDIFFHLNADDQGNVTFDPQWSPRAHGFLRDNAVGQLIMTAGSIIPSPFQPAFVAAKVGDALAHEKYGKALLAALPYGAQELGITDAIKSSLGLGGYSGLDMGEVIPQGGIAEYLPSGLDMGEVIPRGGIAEYLPDEIDQLLSNRLDYPDPSFDNPMSMPVSSTGSVDITLPIKGSQAAGLDINDNYFTSGVPGEPGVLPVNWGPTTIDDIIDNVGSDWSAGTPTTGMEGKLPADLANYYKGMNEFSETSDTISKLTDNVGNKFDLNGNKITDNLTLDKALNLGKAYLDNPAALAKVVGTGLAATGLVNNVIGGNKVTNKVADTASTSKPVASMVQIGSTPGLQDLFNYIDLYKDSPFAPTKKQTETTPVTTPVTTPESYTPSFTISDVFRSLMADAGPQPKIEPNLVGLADLQKKMMVGK